MGYRVKELRQMKQMSQQTLSEVSGVSRAIISALENDSAAVTTTSTLLKLATALGCTVPELFCI